MVQAMPGLKVNKSCVTKQNASVKPNEGNKTPIKVSLTTKMKAKEKNILTLKAKKMNQKLLDRTIR